MLFGVTMGDASGVGPEIVLNAFRRCETKVEYVVYGDREVLDFYNRKLSYGIEIHSIVRPGNYRPGLLNLIDLARMREVQVTPGKINRMAGEAARDYVIAATRAALSGDISAMVTLPMNKEATQLSDPDFVGHTELIGEVCKASDVTIMLVSSPLIVTHVTTHVSLSEAIQRVKRDRVQRIIELTVEAVRKFRANPRIAIAGLNPHGGENGLFGLEDLREIVPAVEWARERGMPVEGPLPADTLFYLAVKRKRYDAIVCMYHDQGHIPLKLLDFENAVNVALGLPIIRTSVDHGTAFDIAGQGIASTQSFIAALNMAARLVTANVS